MKRYHWVRLYALLLMIILFSLAVFVGIKSAFSIFSESARQRSIVRGVQVIGDASDAIISSVGKIAKDAGCEQYDRLLELVKVEDDSVLSEKELEGYFRTGYSNKIKDALGKDSSQICDKLNSFIKEAKLENVSVKDNGDTHIEETKDNTGISALWIRNVTIVYDDPLTGGRTDTVSYSIQFPEAIFHAGNDDLFRYCMVAAKGIYMTGRTSSIIGDVYAGEHNADECREAEIVYGETGTYGGFNMLSTQVGMRSDLIISEGDININGSFVNMAPNNSQLECYAQRINEIEGFSKDASYSLDGRYFDTYKMEEGPLNKFLEAKELVKDSLGNLDITSIYYDSDNDREYNGKYRKLISGADVELKNDFTGIVATRANVIIERDVNFEGVILCGDRIYAMGNNNIVASPGVARAIIASESGEDYMFRVRDYIGGLKDAGLTDPDYYVIPFRKD